MSGPGVVERASKEISRRIHSLGFSKRARSQDRGGDHEQQQQQQPRAPSEEQQAKAAAADKLNGNEAAQDGGGGGSGGSGGGGGGGGISVASSSVSKMGTIIRGSVMDKVTHVFNSSNMGNAGNKENGGGGGGQKKAAAAAAAASEPTSINIPKGKLGNSISSAEVLVLYSSDFS